MRKKILKHINEKREMKMSKRDMLPGDSILEHSQQLSTRKAL